MQASDKAEFAKVLLGFAEIKGKQLSQVGVEMYWSAMQGWDIADFKAAANRLLQTSQFFPTPKEFEDLRKSNKDTSGEAWQRVLHIAKNLPVVGGYFQEGTSGDPVVDAAARALGGYKAIAMHDSDKLHFLEKRFAEHYESIKDAEETRESVPALAGPTKHEVSSLLMSLTKGKRLS